MDRCFIDCCRQVIDEMEIGNVRKKDGDNYSRKTIRTIRTDNEQLGIFVKETVGTVYLNDINEGFIEKYQKYLIEREYSKNTISARLNRVEFWIRRFYKENLITYGGKVGSHPSEITAAYPLSIEDIKELYAMQLPNGQKKVLDIFICQCFLGLRVGDMFKFLSNIEARKRVVVSQLFFEVFTGKSRSPVVIPAARIVTIIIDRYGKSLERGFSESHYNSTLKKIVAKSVIDRNVVFYRTQGGKAVEKIVLLSSLISSHTARITFATNGYLAGISPFDLMKITGHKSLQSFFRYTRCENIAVAYKISKHDFFRINFNINHISNEI